MRRTPPYKKERASRCGRFLPACLILCLLVAPAPSPCGDGEDVEELTGDIAKKVRQNLTSLPDYTCQLTIDRWRADGQRRSLEHRDKVRLEVAYLDGEELFSWPGANDFKEHSLRDLVSGGAMSKGSYALHLHNVFLSGAAETHYEGRVTKDGIDCHRFTYRLDGVGPGLRVVVGDKSEMSGYGGSFWVASETLDLVRFEVSLDSLPAELGLEATEEGITYERIEIGGGSFVLPARTQMTMRLDSGVTLRNEAEYTNCRQYATQTTISFGVPEEIDIPDSPEPARGETKVTLPKGLRLELATETPISSETTAVGDEIRAVVKKAVERENTTVVPRGALAILRVQQLEQVPTQGRNPRIAHRVRLRLERLQFATSHADADCALKSVTLADGEGVSVVVEPEWSFGRTARRIQRTPGEFHVFSPGGDFVLGTGTVMVWRTQ